MDIWEEAVKMEVPLPEIWNDKNHLISGKGIIEPIQFLVDCRVHRIDAKKFPVAQTSQ